jgi:type II secretory pathway pseudopilin PulG
MVKREKSGYVLIILMMAVFILALGLTVAVPVLETELRREKEEELIFRGRQYAEAVRLYQAKNPGRFPASLKELLDKGFLRKLSCSIPAGRPGPRPGRRARSSSLPSPPWVPSRIRSSWAS